jgi:hypothetical protein
MDRKQTPPEEGCHYSTPLTTAPVEGGYRARCMVCGALGPRRESAVAAVKALRESGESSDSDERRVG